MRSNHTGLRFSGGLIQTLRAQLKIGGKIGPGTADNAFNNKTVAAQMSDLLLSELGVNQSGSKMVRCSCHFVFSLH